MNESSDRGREKGMLQHTDFAERLVLYVLGSVESLRIKGPVSPKIEEDILRSSILF